MTSFVFPTVETLQIALSSGLVPVAAQASGVGVAREADGRVIVTPSRPLDADAARALRMAGVTTTDRVAGRAASCWAEAVPLVRDAGEAGGRGVVLIAVSDVDGALGVAAEMLRLGCDRQQLAFFEGEGGATALIRVADPPFWTLSRALEAGPGAGLVAYASVGNGAWVELGHRHPLATALAVPEGALLLVGTGGWQVVPDGPWTDVLALADVLVEPATAPLRPVPAPHRLAVRLRLGRGAHRPPTLWILAEDGLDAVDRLLQELPEAVTDRLEFAVVDELVLLRARPGRPPPELDLHGRAFAASAWFPNLLLPVGTAIEPPLRRDRLRELLAPPEGEIAWVEAEGGPLRTRRIAESAFAPLIEWIDWLVDRDAEALQGWVRSAAFAFEPFRIAVGAAPAPEAPAPPDRARRRKEGPPPPEVPIRSAGSGSAPAEAAPRRRLRTIAVDLSPTAAEAEAEAAEQRFLALTGPADLPERLPLWSELAALYARIGRRRDAGLCWTRFVWELDGDEASAGLADWAAGEAALVYGGGALERLLALDAPDRDDVRAVAAAVASDAEVPDLHAAQAWLDRHDAVLDARSLWLSRLGLARRVGGDPLVVAGARDRVLAALRSGLPVQANVPTFLRLAGARGPGARLGPQLEALLDRFRRVKRKRSVLEAQGKPEHTAAIVELVFAWGFARLGQAELARGLRAQAVAVLEPGDAIHRFIAGAYGVRVEQALDGLPAETPLPGELAAALNGLGRLERYKIDRLRQASAILEPQERLDPMRGFVRAEADPRGTEFAPLRGLDDVERLALEIDRILTTSVDREPAERARTFDAAMDFLPALPPGLAEPLLDRIVIEAARLGTADRAAVLEEALLVTAGLGRPDRGPPIAVSLREALVSLGAADETVARLLGRAVRSLRRLHLDGEAATLLEGLVATTTGATHLVARVGLAGGLLSVGRRAEAEPVLEEAFVHLGREVPVPERLVLSRALSAALARAEPAAAVAGVQRLADQLPGITDSYNTNSHFCLSIVELAESLVLGLAHEDLSMGDTARRWLDDDEHLVRRRIHEDLERRVPRRVGADKRSR